MNASRKKLIRNSSILLQIIFTIKVFDTNSTNSLYRHNIITSYFILSCLHSTDSLVASKNVASLLAKVEKFQRWARTSSTDIRLLVFTLSRVFTRCATLHSSVCCCLSMCSTWVETEICAVLRNFTQERTCSNMIRLLSVHQKKWTFARIWLKRIYWECDPIM